MIRGRGAGRRIAPVIVGLALLAGLVLPASAAAVWRGLVTGVNEPNPVFFTTGDVPDGFGPYRDAAVALHPRYYRLNINWSSVQPSAGAAPDFDRPYDGCERGVAPCAPYAGLRATLRAIRARQLADNGWRVVVSLFGTPSWATAADAPPGNCASSSYARAPDLEAYKGFVRALVALGQQEHVRLAYWSPWNEPNHPAFLAPQHEGCVVGGRDLMPAVYTGIVRAMNEARGTASGLILGEMAQIQTSKATSTGVDEFIGELPDDVVCSAAAWGQHAYVPRSAGLPGAPGASSDLIDNVSNAIAAHHCARTPQIWMTETGIGSAHSNEPRDTSPETLLADCKGIQAALRSWANDRRVDAAFQYTFREDPVFRVGLADAALTQLYTPYAVWKAWGGESGRGDPVPADVCST